MLMRVNMRPYDIDTTTSTRGGPSICRYIDILGARDNSPSGHPALAMVRAMRHAKANGKRIVYLSVIDTSLAHYLTNSFGDGVHAFVLCDEDTFEVTRRFALSPSHSAHRGICACRQRRTRYPRLRRAGERRQLRPAGERRAADDGA